MLFSPPLVTHTFLNKGSVLKAEKKAERTNTVLDPVNKNGEKI